MKMFIPTIGTEFKLSTDWTFDLHDDRRNETLIKQLGIVYPERNWRDPANDIQQVTLLAGTVIKIDRIYIRKGNSGYDSVSMWATIEGQKGKKRFWVKLHDFNNIEAEDI